MRRRSDHPLYCRRGFTLMELVLGMIVTGLVMSAVAGLLTAVGQGWQQSEQAQAGSTYRVHGHARLQRILRGASLFGAVRAGSIEGNLQAAALLLWKSDDNGDKLIQLTELAVIVHEGAVGTPDGYLACYEIVEPTAWASEQSPVPEDELYLDSNIDTFRTEPLASLANVQMTVVASNVVGAVFTRTDGADMTRPSFDYVLKFNKDGNVQVEYGTVSSRAPARLPVSQR